LNDQGALCNAVLALPHGQLIDILRRHGVLK
jgi:hypothetical protein